MKSKLTLTINREIIGKAKIFVRRRGTSISALVEKILAKTIDEKKDPFVARWTGKFELAEKDEKRYQKLKQRYL